tara:strand:- start:205 stop:384 length:180 start_codon:yes stop_codon:yes gene_type:complete
MNRKEFKLLMENWRSDFISEGLEEEVHEEAKESDLKEIEENSIDEDLGGYHIASPFDED